MIQKPLLWVEVGKVLEYRMRVRVDFLSGCLVRNLPVLDSTLYHKAFLFLANYSHDRYSCSVLRPISLSFLGFAPAWLRQSFGILL
jgi:hypothetical protein